MRDVLFAPWRLSYIKRGRDKVMAPQCVFCDAVKTGVGFESLVLYTGATAAVILNKFPYNNGHTMIIPQRHSSDLSDLREDEFTEIHTLLKKTYSAIQKVYSPGGLNIGMNVGKTGGAGIADHLHYHIVPRWDGDSNFMPIIGGTKIISESLEDTYNKLLPQFKK